MGSPTSSVTVTTVTSSSTTYTDTSPKKRGYDCTKLANDSLPVTDLSWRETVFHTERRISVRQNAGPSPLTEKKSPKRARLEKDLEDVTTRLAEDLLRKDGYSTDEDSDEGQFKMEFESPEYKFGLSKGKKERFTNKSSKSKKNLFKSEKK